MLPIIAGIALAVLEKIFEKVAKGSHQAETKCATLKTKCKSKNTKKRKQNSK
jgi:hypothetical protein